MYSVCCIHYIYILLQQVYEAHKSVCIIILFSLRVVVGKFSFPSPRRSFRIITISTLIIPQKYAVPTYLYIIYIYEHVHIIIIERRLPSQRRRCNYTVFFDCTAHKLCTLYVRIYINACNMVATLVQRIPIYAFVYNT